MKVASFTLIFSLFLFLFTAVFTYSEASSSTLLIRGHVPDYFGIEYSYSSGQLTVKPRTNFEFYGEVIEKDAKLSSSAVKNGANSNYKVVSIIIN